MRAVKIIIGLLPHVRDKRYRRCHWKIYQSHDIPHADSGGIVLSEREKKVGGFAKKTLFRRSNMVE